MAQSPESPESDDPQWARRALLQRLESLQRSGVSVFPKTELPTIAVRTTAISSTKAPPPTAATSRANPAFSPSASVSPPIGHGSTGGQASTGQGAAISSNSINPSDRQENDLPKKSTAKPAAKPAAKSPPAILPAAGLLAEKPFSELPKITREQRTGALQVLRDEVSGCTRCGELARTRTQTVFGVGNIQPRLCFFGEAPGADEDAQGEPFVGRAGQLLNDIITKGMGLRREDVFILNVLKCRPPNNRPPEEVEVSNCRHFFERQLEVLRPEFICCLGASAAKALLNTTTSIGMLRGRFYNYRGAQVIATYHPAYLLRNPSAKKEVWADIKILMQEMGIAAPAKKAEE